MKRKYALTIILVLGVVVAFLAVADATKHGGKGVGVFFTAGGTSGMATRIINSGATYDSGNLTITSGTGTVTGTGTNHYWPYWTSSTALGSKSITASKPICSDVSGDPAVCAGTEGVWKSASAATTLTDGGNATLAAPAAFYVCTGACTVTLPIPGPGYEFCVFNDDNVTSVIKIAVPTNVFLENTARTSYATVGYRLVSGGAAADKICFIGRDALHYMTPSSNGTWTATIP